MHKLEEGSNMRLLVFVWIRGFFQVLMSPCDSQVSQKINAEQDWEKASHCNGCQTNFLRMSQVKSPSERTAHRLPKQQPACLVICFPKIQPYREGHQLSRAIPSLDKTVSHNSIPKSKAKRWASTGCEVCSHLVIVASKV